MIFKLLIFNFFIMTQATIFVAMIIGVALIMAFVVLSVVWSVFKQTVAYRHQAYQPRKAVMESKMLGPVSKAISACLTLILYLLFVTLMVLFGKITVGLFLGGLIVSVAIGLGLYLIINLFQKEIETRFTKIDFDF